MRGEKSLYLPHIANQEDYEPSGRGRSDFLIARRDRKLILRYYFYTKIKRLNFESIIKLLTFEFDLAERTITDRLQLKYDSINEVMKLNPAVLELKREFPYFNWN